MPSSVGHDIASVMVGNTSKPRRIAHLTSVHARYDTRIFSKQCRSLAREGYHVTLVVADGKADEERDGVFMVDVGRTSGRLSRMILAARRVFRQAVDLKADLYHIHDPELLPAGLMLKLRGRRVIFDAHEDLPDQILGKPYLHPFIRRAVALSVAIFERFACGRLDATVAAMPIVQEKFVKKGIRCVNINNYPIIGELESEAGWELRQRQVCFVGGLDAIRGAQQLADACAFLRSDARISFVGLISEQSTANALRCSPGWVRVDELGFQDRKGVRDVMARSVAGIVTYLPFPNHVDAQPNKMFEYMAAGLPVIASDFPLWRSIVEGNDCGICVDPLDPSAIAAAIDRLVENPEMARRMGENGQRAVRERYNWAKEERKLLALYDDILSGRKAGASPQADAPA